MAPVDLPLTLETLLAHREWVRALARQLLGDENRVDDVEQQTWLSALRSPPKRAGSPRAWLGTVVRNVVRATHRGDARRNRRERASARPEALPATDDIVAAAEAHGRVVHAVLALDEPFRTTVLHRFFGGLPPREIAERMGVPVETVRSRTRRALARLREHLDTSCGSDGRAWGALLLPLVEAGPSPGPGAGALAVATGNKILLVVACTVGFAVISAVWFVNLPPQPDGLVTTGHTIPDDPEGPAIKGERVPRVRIEKPASLPITPAAKTDGTAGSLGPEAPVAVTRGAGPHIDATPLRPELHTRLSASKATAKWDELLEVTRKKARDEYVKKLAKWCDKNELEWTANYVRRRAFLYLPDDPEMRPHFGYERRPDGTWIQTEERKTALRAIVDLDDPASTKYSSNIAKADAKVAKLFLGLARKAAGEAERSEDAATRALFEERARRAYEWVLLAQPDNKYAHRALGHPKFDGEYVTPFALPFLEARAARREQGERSARGSHTVLNSSIDGAMLESGLPAEAAKTQNWVILTTHSLGTARRLGAWAERALDDLVAVYDFPNEVRKRKSLRRLNIVKSENDRAELEQFLTQGAKWRPADVTRIRDRFGGTTLRGGETVMATRTDDRSADDYVIHYTGHAVVHGASGMALQDLGHRAGYTNSIVDSWLRESVSYDVTRRLTGTTLTTCGAFGKYGRNVAAKPGQDPWIILARRQVEMDDDVPLAQLCQKGMNDLRGPGTVKGYALLQFLFESDATRARKFVWHALAHGTPGAVVDVYADELGVEAPTIHKTKTKPDKGTFDAPVYQEAMERLDARYREWIVRTH